MFFYKILIADALQAKLFKDITTKYLDQCFINVFVVTSLKSFLDFRRNSNKNLKTNIFKTVLDDENTIANIIYCNLANNI